MSKRNVEKNDADSPTVGPLPDWRDIDYSKKGYNPLPLSKVDKHPC